MGQDKEIDITNTDQDYWNQILSEEGLSMKKGIHPKLVYKGGTNEVLNQEEIRAEKKEGRVRKINGPIT